MIDAHALPVTATDGHRFELLARVPARPRARLLWLPALGVAARHYLPLAEALAAHGVAVYLHEWRGNGSSSLRPSRTQDWGYREILQTDLPASLAALQGSAAADTILGGHSLGGQLACCLAGQHPAQVQRLWLVASGTPYWRTFPAPRGWTLPLIYRFLPWLAQRQGVLHGRRLGFGGTEARGLIGDWAKVGLNNHYAGAGIAQDLEAGLRRLRGRATAVVMADDWLAPKGSMQGLLAKLPQVDATLAVLSAAALGTRADHFAWMKSPQAVADLLFHSLE
ncbi:alpha/beta hydrolase family protein [Stenotrophomonas rhizophila]|uniref:alpha/beta hydrolase family protein n=1 Tax=Stenotrophomonas rhizophila TaxID=216778 RepID=UPI001E5BB853|nr:alpha/beta fold hydrolase [Stenotrophomonas rhizophila]MCC7635936.1 alpha/beta fold hydrolase [Stenotrophomonas rhizophila]MCC7665087.1 alpha/beta fold hydrolase [Stenotrophomonas rhizophila]